MQKNSLLWEIRDPRQPERRSYLFGTIHIRDERFFQPLPLLRECIERCGCFAAEFDLEEGDPQQLEAALCLPDGQTLPALFSPRIYAKLDKLVRRELGQPLARFDRQKPMVIQNLLSESQFAREEARSLDETLYRIAQASGKTTRGLESFAAQIAALEQMPLKAQVQSLRGAATHFAKLRRQLRKTAAAYLAGDLRTLQQQVRRSTGGLRKLLLHRRNVHMAERIEALHRESAVFAAIGAGHLAGGRGVLRLLKKAGLQVRPLPTK